MDQQIAHREGITSPIFRISVLDEPNVDQDEQLRNQISQGGLLSNELSFRPSITFLRYKNSLPYSDYYLETHTYDDVNDCEFSRIVIQDSESIRGEEKRFDVLTRLLFYESSNIKKFSLFIVDNTVDTNVIDTNTTSSFDGKIIILTSFSDNLIKLHKKMYLVNNNLDMFPMCFVEKYIIPNKITDQNKKLLLVVQKHDNNKKIKVIASYSVQNDVVEYNLMEQLFFQTFEKNICTDVILHKGHNIIKLPNNVPVRSFFIISSREHDITVRVNASWKNTLRSVSSVTFNKYVDAVDGLYDLQYLSIPENNVFVFDPFCSLNELQVRMSVNNSNQQIIGHCMFSDDSLIEINSNDDIQIQICYNTYNAMMYNLKDYDNIVVSSRDMHNYNYQAYHQLNGCKKFIQTSSYFDENINNKVDSFIEQFNLLDDKSHLKEVMRHFRNKNYLKSEDYLKMFPVVQFFNEEQRVEEQYTRLGGLAPISQQNFPDNVSDASDTTDVPSHSNQIKYINKRKLNSLMCEIYYNRNMTKQIVNALEKFLYATPKKLAKGTICNISFEQIKNKEYYYECSKCLNSFCSTEYKKWCYSKFKKNMKVSCPICRSSDIGMDNLYLNKHPTNYKSIGLTAMGIMGIVILYYYRKSIFKYLLS